MSGNPISGPILELKNAHKAFGPKQVLRGVDLTVARGQSLVIIGGSGTGKSVTIKSALGLIPLDKGEIRFAGEAANDGKSIAALRRRTGMLFQGGALFDSLRVWENVGFRLTNADGVSKAEAKARAVEALARSGVARLVLIDLDHVAESNINRQVQALGSTLGMAKAEALRQRIADIHPGCQVQCVEDFAGPDNWPGLLPGPVDVLIDACDQSAAKLALVALMVVAPATALPVFWAILVLSTLLSHAPGALRHRRPF